MISRFSILAALLLAIAAPNANANPYLLVMLQAQRAKCVIQHPELKPNFDQAIEKLASRPPSNLPADPWKELLSVQVQEDVVPGSVSVEECTAFAEKLGNMDLAAMFESTSGL